MPKPTHRNPDHVQRHNTPSPNNDAIANQLEALLTPAIFAQQAKYRQLGLRTRRSESAIDGGSSVNNVVATSSGRAGVDLLISTRRLTVVSSYKSNPTSADQNDSWFFQPNYLSECLKIYCRSCNRIGSNETIAPCRIVSTRLSSILNGFGWLTLNTSCLRLKSCKVNVTP